MNFFGGASLHEAISEYVAHDHEDRAHHGISYERNEHQLAVGGGDVVCEERLGCVLECSRRAAKSDIGSRIQEAGAAVRLRPSS